MLFPKEFNSINFKWILESKIHGDNDGKNDKFQSKHCFRFFVAVLVFVVFPNRKKNDNVVGHPQKSG